MFTLGKKSAVASIIAAAVFAVGTVQAADEVKVTKDSPFTEKVSYSIGASLGTYIHQMQKTQTDLIGELNNDYIVAGFVDSLNDKTALESADIEATLRELDKKVQTALEDKMKKKQLQILKPERNSLRKTPRKKV